MSQKNTPQDLTESLDLMLVATLWQHVAYGYEPVTPNLSHVGGVYRVTREGFDAALDTYKHIAQEMADAGITRDQAWSAVPALAPWAVEIVGTSGWTPGVYQDFSGAGA